MKRFVKGRAPRAAGKRMGAALLFFALLCSCSVVFAGCGEEKEVASCEAQAVFDGKTLNVQAEFRYVNEGEREFSRLPFLLYTSAYREGAKYPVATADGARKIYPKGVDYMQTEILSASSDGEERPFSVGGKDENVLTVDLGKTVFPGEEARVGVEYRLTLPECRFRTGTWEEKVNLGDWLPAFCPQEEEGFREIVYSPLGDPYDQPVCDYEVSLTLPSGYVVACGGVPTGTTVDGQTTTYRFSLKKGRDISFVLGKKFNVASGEGGGVTVSYYTERENFQDELSLALDCVDYFSSLFGEYPYAAYSVAETAFAYGGMEYSGLSVLSDCLDEKERRRAIVHETAHQWWRGGVGFDQTVCHYLDEGLAEYSAYLYWKDRGQPDEAEEMLRGAISAYKSFFEINALLDGTADTTMERDLSTFSSLLEYGNIAYNKSLVMFCRYGEAIGERKAKQRLKKFYQNNLFGTADLSALTKDLGYAEHFRSFAEGKVLL